VFGPSLGCRGRRRRGWLFRAFGLTWFLLCCGFLVRSVCRRSWISFSFGFMQPERYLISRVDSRIALQGCPPFKWRTGMWKAHGRRGSCYYVVGTCSFGETDDLASSDKETRQETTLIPLHYTRHYLHIFSPFLLQLCLNLLPPLPSLSTHAIACVGREPFRHITQTIAAQRWFAYGKSRGPPSSPGPLVAVRLSLLPVLAPVL
jgi:hypothetical protein